MNSSSKAPVTADDTSLKDEIEAYEKICSVLDQSKYLRSDDDERYDLNKFWADHKKVLPMFHYLVYIGDCGSKRASSASVETVYSGATKLSDGADQLADDVLAAYIYCHYNWGFEFLRPTISEIVAEYERVHGKEPPVCELSSEGEDQEDQEDQEEEGQQGDA